MVFIASNWMARPSPAKVIVYSNCDQIALSLNGKLIATQKPDSGPDVTYSGSKPGDPETLLDSRWSSAGGQPFNGGCCVHLKHPPFTFMNVPCAPGNLTAVGYIAGKAVAQFTARTPGPATNLSVAFDTQRKPLLADGADCVFVRVNILDANGTIVQTNDLPSLHLSVSGPARLIGTDPIHVEAGVASVLLQATDHPGKISVTAAANGLTSATESITSEAADDLAAERSDGYGTAPEAVR
jgi:beta-galactosidase